MDALSVALRRPVLLDDAALVPLAYSRQWGEIDAVRSESILGRGAALRVREVLFAQGIAEATAAIRTSADHALDMAERVCVPVRTNHRTVAYIWLLDPDGGLSEEDLERARETAHRVALVLTQADRGVTADEAPLLGALRSPSVADRKRAREEVHARGLLSDGPVVLCLMSSFVECVDATRVARQAVRRLSVGHAISGAAPEGAALLAALGDPVLRPLPAGDVAAWLHATVRGEVAVGQSCATDLDAVHEGARQAGLALRVARSRPAGATFAAWAGLGADRLIAQLPPGACADVPEALSRLLRDEPALAGTLAAFLDAGGDVKATATALSLHRSGLYYRLRRIEEIGGLRMESGDDRLLAHLALRIARLS